MRFTQLRLILAVYRTRDHAEEALGEACKRGFRRSAVVHRDRDGSLKEFHAGFTPAIRALFSFLVGGLTAALAVLHEADAIRVLLSTGAGFAAAWFGSIRLGYGLPSQLLRRWGRYVLPGESLLLVKEREERAQDVVALIDRVAHPFISTIRPEGAAKPEALAHQHPEHVTTAALPALAEELASSHELQAGPGKRSLLPMLDSIEAGIEAERSSLSEAVRLGYAVSHSAEWLLDNAYLIRSHIADIRHDLPDNYHRILPVLRGGGKFPYRIYQVASHLVDLIGHRLTSENIILFLDAYQNRTPLLIAELWVFPLMLRLALLERISRYSAITGARQREKELADLWANRLIQASHIGSDVFDALLGQLELDRKQVTPHFIARLAEQVQKEEGALAPMQSWLEARTGGALADAIRREHAHEAHDQMLIASAIGSLRELSELQYPAVVEAVSRIERTLRRDPAGVHAKSDFDTRDRCRRAVETTARRSALSELEVAELAVQLAEGAPWGSRERCVAYYLINDGVEELHRRCRGHKLPWQEREVRFLYRHATSIYLSGLFLLTAGLAMAFLGPAASAGISWPLLGALALLVAIPASELATFLFQTWLTWVIPPRTLPKLEFQDRIPDEYRTLVVVPMMLLTPDAIRGEIEKLEVRYLSNPDPNLCFALLADFTDAPQPAMPEDAELLQVALNGIRELNARYGEDAFLLFHRNRVWCETEQSWIGWERKRGKLEELNRYLLGEESGVRLLAGLPPGNIRYVITLDSDTQLPHGSARRLIETIAHPLNRIELTEDGRNRLRGYTIIQPRVGITLPSATATRFTRLFSDARGTDPYCQAVSDVYQDLFREGIYHGKAIYDLQAFHQILDRRFPEQHLLSHDLIEGVHVGVGLASDIELFEQFPVDYHTYAKRQHRWTRGDWQIAAWFLPKVPSHDPGHRDRNPLSAISRWKVFDNLRRSLVPPASLLLLIIAWSFNIAPVAATLLVAGLVLVPLLLSISQRLYQSWQGDIRARYEASTDLSRALIMAAFLPHQAYLTVDAVLRVAHRRLISRKHLLEWQTAEVSHLIARSESGSLRVQFIIISAFVAGYLLVLAMQGRAWNLLWTPILLLWLIAPLLERWIGRRKQAIRRGQAVEGEEEQYLRRVARETWRYFDDFVNAEHNWLPPDNFQESLRIEVAARTSPTNIGMWLSSAVSAYDLRFITPLALYGRCSATLDTLEKLERFEGHILNWYETRTLEPLHPRYVSTVDSGNLIASLWVLAQTFRAMPEEPVLPLNPLQGLITTVDVIHKRFPPDRKTAGAIQLLTSLLPPEDTPAETIQFLRMAAEQAPRLADGLRWAVSDTEERSYWFQQLETEIKEWVRFADRYVRWFEILAEPPDSFLQPLGPDVIKLRRSILLQLPSWRVIAEATPDLLSPILESRSTSASLPGELASWISELEAEYQAAQEACREAIGWFLSVADRAERLADEMNMEFLYDQQRRLFVIGYEVGAILNKSSHYDLLASEARLGSLVAIAKGDVPVNHWLALGRPYTSARGQVLLSWSGTMFEYLMPLLYMRTFQNSLLENACTAAVEAQIQYASERGVPWGISESAYSALDFRRTYQYRAFGVPSLGLKRGLEDELVIAPYATALALPIKPAEAVRNLMRLERSGMRGRLGFYEALDYGRQKERGGDKGVIIYAYMAHHQGMSLCAINNLLNRGILQRRFHSDRRVKAMEPLLFERIPPKPSTLLHLPSDLAAIRPVSEPAEPSYRILDEETITPRIQLLGNGNYSLMITNAGSGYSRWRDIEIGRWRSDATRDPWGMFFYVREEGRLEPWSITHQPSGVQDSGYSVIYGPDRAEFHRTRDGIEAQVEVIVSPEDDAEIRRVTLSTQSPRDRLIELTSAMELSLARHEADRAHPGFNKLFIQTEARPDLQAVIAWRRSRSPSDSPVWVAQFLTEGPLSDGTMVYETDRSVFLGRGRSWRNPEMSARKTSGYVLDPVFVLRKRLSLPQRQRKQIYFVTVAAASREDLMHLIAKYREFGSCTRAFELAWSHAQLEFRYLGIQAQEAFQFCELAGHILYPSQQLRAPASRLRRNLKGQSGLWAYGVSGDLPIVAVAVSEESALTVVREVLIAHTYWRLRGLKVDLVILNREPASYDQPLHQQLARLVEAHSAHSGIDQPGGIFLRKTDQMPEEDQNLILSAASVVIGPTRGPLSGQLRGPSALISLPGALPKARIPEQPSEPLPFLELPYFNGLGGFTSDGREYATYLGPGRVTPLPWINVMANPEFGAFVSESGPGCCWYGNSQSNRLIPWSNDPVSDPSRDALYIRDEESGVFWTPTATPVRERDAYRARHGQGYTEFEHNSHALRQKLLVYVPVTDSGGYPVRVQRLWIQNASSRHRRLSVTSFADLVLGTDREATQMHIVTSLDPASGALFATNRYHRDYGDRVTFLAMSPRATSYSGDRTAFLGRYGDPAAPAALGRQSLSGRAGAGLDPCAALQTHLELSPGQEATVIILLGQASDEQAARQLIGEFSSPDSVASGLEQTRGWWDRLLGTIQVTTPILSVNLLLNRWLLYQSLSCRIWGRTAFYQSSGAYGFRDQLQDSLALVYSAPAISREMILRAASRQFLEGDVQHWWHMPSGEGIRSKCSDDLLWLPYAVSQYLAVTGDWSILDESVPFLEGPQLAEDEHEIYFPPTVSLLEAPVFEHCRRAIEKGDTRGPHDLPLIGIGDWNDGMNSVGDEGRGESVWLAWFLVDVLNRFAAICDRRGEAEQAEAYRSRVRELTAAIENAGWDGAWYRRAYFDDGTPLGSHSSPEARIDSLSQSWAAITGAGNPERARQAMSSVDQHLVRKQKDLVLLFTPPFDRSEPHPGYIMGYPPGVRENGGQYTHAATWVAMAFARLKDGGRAVEVLQKLNPIEHSRTPEDCSVYRTEPYAVAADIYSLESQPGRGGWTWYTGSAGWLYRVWLEEVLGFKLSGDTLRIEPVIPDSWPGFSIRFRYGGTPILIEVENAEGQSDGEIRLVDDGEPKTYRIRTRPSAGEHPPAQSGPDEKAAVPQPQRS